MTLITFAVPRPGGRFHLVKGWGSGNRTEVQGVSHAGYGYANRRSTADGVPGIQEAVGRLPRAAAELAG
ncbi:hypothetical protein SLNWT_1820 [Streptomyces albus]|uniref:Uncharacterized protein n=1 Tax=Streptomyces albus (strain ATCC 21838 / DSM 41398 / FERM P-419 / JCM 4703 / NBRC 107858) TaxID=1081613 RepID=A0A0B5EU02_STRA4|nr:hypothetical protein SLNWT_1820 [Streptomyces albus]AOU76511.1 hypothetical protein SLNHY_1820 [Streptomyces albus]AYN32294.1 hypothetical protein DUI70_1792 [Streptomyces albus]